ncbi:UDP-N-acetylmuramate--L-alanine ligase [Aminivibrio sp.]|uniref:UDP-N-acetylmuramate--L-alanine ligase n=1 Tax=Aminivibrio sp. TaxID=1872489 RepID=UPI001A4ACD2A|nr:UDP-N-acetylmuramate--L-alanine ligase [Aminivibrio sp.]MBL3538907.1 UDP-N-acetylmuramate--L-alanine ligase [Aminivibrio sp.]
MGIGGAGMSGLALLLAELGYEVSGCDMSHTTYVDKVLKEEIAVVLGHGKAHMDKFLPELLVYSSAIPEENEEITAARERGIAVAKRGEVLSWIFDSRFGIGVAGTHGKTTTSSMIALILEQAGLHPTLAIGGELCDIGVNAKLGDGPYMVAELDESDGSFEKFHPNIAVVTNADWDHVNHYPTFESVLEAFSRFTSNPKDGGLLVLCGEDAGLGKIMAAGPLPREAVTYGWGMGWTWGAFDVKHKHGGGTSFSIAHNGVHIDDMELSVSGDHNILNALAACAVSHTLGIPFTMIRKTLKEFKGAKRRLQHLGQINGVEVYDDYGHHPREIAATLSAIGRMFPEKRLLVAFQPHRFTRTQALYRDFASVLSTADTVFLLPVYQADEEPIEGVSSALINTILNEKKNSKSVMCRSLEEAASELEKQSMPGDIVLTIGAGDISNVGEMFMEKARAEVVHA